MALTRLGWDVLVTGSSTRLEPLPWITGKVRGGDAWTVLNELGRRFNSDVEKIIKAHSWGWANRPVRGARVTSEHAAGTAVDFNAQEHWLGLTGTFTPAQVRAIKQILADLDGAVRWGGMYSGRKDEMHFELQGGVAKLAAVAAKIKAGDIKPTGTITKPATKPKAKAWPFIALREDGDFGKVTIAALQVMLKGIDLYDGKIDGDFGPMTRKAMQTWLAQVGFYDGRIDGDFGGMSVDALQRFLREKREYKGKLDRDWGGVTTDALQGYLNDQAQYFD